MSQGFSIIDGTTYMSLLRAERYEPHCPTTAPTYICTLSIRTTDGVIYRGSILLLIFRTSIDMQTRVEIRSNVEVIYTTWTFSSFTHFPGKSLTGGRIRRSIARAK